MNNTAIILLRNNKIDVANGLHEYYINDHSQYSGFFE